MRKAMRKISAKPNSAETFGFLASPSARSYNRVYLASPKLIALGNFFYPQNVR